MYASACGMLIKENNFLQENASIYVVTDTDKEVTRLMNKLAEEMNVVAELHPAIIPTSLTSAVRTVFPVSFIIIILISYFSFYLFCVI